MACAGRGSSGQCQQHKGAEVGFLLILCVHPSSTAMAMASTRGTGTGFALVVRMQHEVEVATLGTWLDNDGMW